MRLRLASPLVLPQRHRTPSQPHYAKETKPTQLELLRAFGAGQHSLLDSLPEIRAAQVDRAVVIVLAPDCSTPAALPSNLDPRKQTARPASTPYTLGITQLSYWLWNRKTGVSRCGARCSANMHFHPSPAPQDALPRGSHARNEGREHRLSDPGPCNSWAAKQLGFAARQLCMCL